MTDIIAAVSQVIRRVDGNHTMGVVSLAEALHADDLPAVVVAPAEPVRAARTALEEA